MKFRHLFSRRSAAASGGVSLLFFFAFAMTSCGPSSDTPDANLSATSATPAPSAAPAVTPPRMRPQAELAAAFAASTETIFEARTAADLTKLKAAQNVVLTPVANGLKVTATSDAPQLSLPSFAAGKQFILQIVIDSPVGTPIRLFYARREQPVFSEDQAQTLSLKKGNNVVYFQLDRPNLIDSLRLDPSNLAGDYVIESVVARAVATPAVP